MHASGQPDSKPSRAYTSEEKTASVVDWGKPHRCRCSSLVISRHHTVTTKRAKLRLLVDRWSRLWAIFGLAV